MFGLTELAPSFRARRAGARIRHEIRPAPGYDAAVPHARLLITLGVVVLARAADAEPCGDASALRADLQQEAIHADRWNLAWRIGFTASAVGQFAAAASGAFGRDRAAVLWVGGVKSSLGAIVRWILPLQIDVPAATSDACGDRTALRAVAERVAGDERRVFWLSHLGGLAVNLGGTLLIAQRVSWQAGLLSFAVSYPVGLLSTYTMPRASWARIREPTWGANIVAGPDRWSLVVGGSF